MPLEVYRSEGIKESSCAISGDFLDTSGIMKNSMKVGEKTILFLPSAQCLDKSQQNASQIKFDVVQRTNLGTLCESKLVLKLNFCQLPSLPSLLVCLLHLNFPWDRRMYTKLAFVWYFPPSVAPLSKSRKKVFFLSQFTTLTLLTAYFASYIYNSFKIVFQTKITHCYF